MTAFVYILRFLDGSYYVGSTHGETLDKRLGELQAGSFPGYTSKRRAVSLDYAERFDWITDAIAFERRIKSWTRAKEEALIRCDWPMLLHLAKRTSVRNPSNPVTSS